MSNRYIGKYISSLLVPAIVGILVSFLSPGVSSAQTPVKDSTEVSVQENDRQEDGRDRRDRGQRRGRRNKENIPSADERVRPSEDRLDSLVRSRLDSTTLARMDSIETARRDSIARVLADTTTDKPGAIDRPAFSTARDSIVEDFSGKYKMI